MKKILKKLYHYIFRFKSCDKCNTIVDYAFINKNKTIFFCSRGCLWTYKGKKNINQTFKFIKIY